MTKELKPGDRVRIYDSSVCDGAVGVVVRRGARQDWWLTDVIGDADPRSFHRKQLRKLVEKERRRIWIQCADQGLNALNDKLENFVAFDWERKRNDPSFVEFAEVKRKAKP